MVEQMYLEVADLLSKGRNWAALDVLGNENPHIPLNQIAAVRGEPHAMLLARALLWIAAASAKQQSWSMVNSAIAYHAQIYMWPHGSKGDLRFKTFLVVSDPEGLFARQTGMTPETIEMMRISLEIEIPEIEEDMWCGVAEAHLQIIDQEMDAKNWNKAIAESTEGINLVEEKMASNSAWSAALGPFLCRLYGCRGMARYETGAMPQALQDIDKALAMPATYHQGAVDQSLRFFKVKIKNALQQGTKPEWATKSGDVTATSEEQNKKKDKCFIATAAYGSALAPEVATLRRFRDVRLKPHRAGRLFVRLYERYSPPLAEWIAPRRAARAWVQRLVLAPIVWLVRRWTA